MVFCKRLRESEELKRKATIRDVAKRSAVFVATVSRVLNESAYFRVERTKHVSYQA
ncbi:MAG: LacI family DNA-binding transcriptional regulator [Anaerobacillus sp.]